MSFNITLLGITAFILDLIAGFLVIIYSDTFTVVSAAPFAIGAVFCSYAAYNLDSSPILAGLSGLIGIVLFVIGISPILNLLVAFITIAGGGA